MLLFPGKVRTGFCTLWNLELDLIVSIDLEDEEMMELILYYSEDNLRYLPKATLSELLKGQEPSFSLTSTKSTQKT